MSDEKEQEKSQWEIACEAVVLDKKGELNGLVKAEISPNLHDETGRTLLMFAVEKGAVNAVRLLLSKGADPNARDARGTTALHLAAKHRVREAAKALLDAGVNPNNINGKGSTPIFFAAFNGDMDMIELLVKHGADVNARTPDGRTPVGLALEREWQNTAAQLIAKGAEIEKDDWRIGPVLYTQLLSGNYETAGIIIKREAAWANNRDSGGCTYLHIFANRRDVNTVKFLLEMGADPNLKDANEFTPCDVAMMGNEKEMVALFQKFGGKPSGKRIVRKQAASQKVQAKGDRLPTFADVGGMEELKNQLRIMVVAPMKNKELAHKYGVKAGGGVLLHGPPGCGKTHIAKCIAGEAGIPFMEAKYAEIVSKWAGESEQRIAQIFKEARGIAPCVLFFDEVDSIGVGRDSTNSAYDRQLVSVLLTEIDGASGKNEGILIIGATNRKDLVEPALLRPGRLGRHVFVTLPDAKAREEIFRVHLNGKPVGNIGYGNLAMATQGYSGATIAAICEDALMQAYCESLNGKSEKLITDDMLLGIMGKMKPDALAPVNGREMMHYR